MKETLAASGIGTLDAKPAKSPVCQQLTLAGWGGLIRLRDTKPA